MGTFENSFKREIGKNTAKWLSNKIFGDGHSTPYKIITKNESTKREKEVLKRNRENELEKERRKVLREKLRFQEEKLRIIEDEREIKDEFKRKRIEEKEKLARETSEIIETNKKQVLEFNEYLKTIQSFHTRSSDDFNWNCYTEKPDFLSLLNKNVNKIKFFSGCENLKILKEKHYPTYIAFTNGGANVIKCLSNFSLRLETNCDEVLVRKTNFDFNIFTAFLNNKDLTFLFENQYENKIERVEKDLKEIKNKIEEYSEKIYDIKYQKTEYETEINKTNWISGLFDNKKSNLIENIKSLEIKVNNITKELEEIENGTVFYNLNKIHNEYNDYLETIQTIDIIWNESINIFKEQKELYYLSNNLLENKNYQFFEIAEKIFEPFSFVNELNIRSVSNYQNEIHSMDVYVEGRNIVPKEESYLVRDKELKTREFSKKRFWEIYQDYVSSITLRVAKEYFSFFKMRDIVIIKAYSEILDESTGNEETGLILACKIDRNEFYKSNLQHVDPSSCLSRFQLIVDYNPLNGYKIINDPFISYNDDLVSSSEIINEESPLNERLTEDIFCKLIDCILNDRQASLSFFQRKLKIEYETADAFRELLIDSNLIIRHEESYIINLDSL